VFCGVYGPAMGDGKPPSQLLRLADQAAKALNSQS
jgi:hypothetical protein